MVTVALSHRHGFRQGLERIRYPALIPTDQTEKEPGVGQHETITQFQGEIPGLIKLNFCLFVFSLEEVYDAAVGQPVHQRWLVFERTRKPDNLTCLGFCLR